MNSNQILSGEDLKNLYTEHKLTDELQTQENLKKLLNYELDNIGDTVDSNFDFEIIDFCVEKLKEQDPVDEQKLDFLGKKIAYESQEIARQKKQRRNRKRAVQVAAILLVLGAVLVTGKESIAGNFDLIYRLIWEERGEQLVMKSSDSTLSGIEMEEGHLPDRLPDEFSFSKSFKDTITYGTIYNYVFTDSSQNKLRILIKDFDNTKIDHNNEIEINLQSTEKHVINDVTYYYSTNENINLISWIYQNSIYQIEGKYSFEKLEEILSLYVEEQKNQ